MKPLYARLLNRELLDEQPLTVSLHELQELTGIDLKVYILIQNAGRCVRRSELQEVLDVDDWTIKTSLAWLERDCYIEHTKNGWYRVLTFPYDGKGSKVEGQGSRAKGPRRSRLSGAQRACEVVLL